MPKYLYRTLAVLTILNLSSPTQGSETGFELSLDQDSPPFAYVENGEVLGIVPDLLMEIVDKRMGIPVDFSTYPWGRAQQLVRDGTHDGMVTNPTEARLEYAHSSREVLYEALLAPLTRTGSAAADRLRRHPDVDTLRTLRFCHGKASGWHAAFAEHNALKTFGVTDSEACVRMIHGGRMDVMVYAEDMLLWDVRNLGLRGEVEAVEAPFGAWGLTLMVGKGSSFGDGFLDDFDQTVAAMKADGSYAELIREIRKRYR